jgi:hypothetical protein
MTTGIPIEVLFAVIGAMLVAIYADIKWEVRKLRVESNKRGQSIALIRQAVNAICNHIKLPFHVEDNDNG